MFRGSDRGCPVCCVSVFLHIASAENTGAVQSLLIPNFGSNPDGAYIFIDYMLSDTAQQILVKEMAAIPLVDVSGMDMTGYEDLKDLDVGSFRTLSIGDLGTNFNERWDNEIGSLG